MQSKFPDIKLIFHSISSRNSNLHGFILTNTMNRAMEVDATTEDPEQIKIRESVEAITGAADQLLTRGQTEIYEQEREMVSVVLSCT